MFQNSPIGFTKKYIPIIFWLVIIATTTLGSAFGDYLSNIIGLSYLNGALVTASIIVIVVLFHYFTKINHIILFWIAFVFTRPFGATLDILNDSKHSYSLMNLFTSIKILTILIMRKNALVFLLLTLFISCSSGNNYEMARIEYTSISKGNLYGAGNEGIVQQNMVITDQNSWNSLIVQMNSENNVSENFSEIDINFSKYKIIVIFDGVKPNGGHSIEVSIMSNSENIIVNITKFAPEGNATAVITQPYNIVKIPTSELSIIFE